MAGQVFKTGQWPMARSVTNSQKFAKNIQSEYSRAMMLNGQILRGEVVQGIRSDSLGLEQISEITRTIRGAGAPLADTGNMTNSVTVQMVTPTVVFVGVPAGNKNARIAEIMHNGHIIGINISTPKGRRAFAAMAHKVRKKNKKFKFDQAGAKAGFIFSPPRPFFPPAWDKAYPKFAFTYQKAGLNVWQRQKG